MTSQAKRRIDTQRKILDAANLLFKRQGFDDTSVDQIVVMADVAKGTFYQYFQTKIDVALAITDKAQRKQLEDITKKLAAGQSPLSVGWEFMETTANWTEKNRRLARPLLLHALEQPRAVTPNSARTLWALIFAAAQRANEIRSDLPAEQISELLLGSIALIVLHWTSHGKRGQLAEWLGFVWKLHLEGALPR
jgi:AcrR family transcriptional regulator